MGGEHPVEGAPVTELLLDVVGCVIKLHEPTGPDGGRCAHVGAGEGVQVSQRREHGADMGVGIDLGTVARQEGLVW